MGRETPMVISQSALEGLVELKDFKEWNGEPIKNSVNSILLKNWLAGENGLLETKSVPFRKLPSDQWTFVSDASEDRVCIYQEGVESKLAVIPLAEDEKKWSSSRRELVAIDKALTVKAEFFKAQEFQSVFWLTDNSNVVKIFNKGSGKADILPVSYTHLTLPTIYSV